jgi:hypothetical protein
MLEKARRGKTTTLAVTQPAGIAAQWPTPFPTLVKLDACDYRQD